MLKLRQPLQVVFPFRRAELIRRAITRCYSAAAVGARLNVPTDFSTTPIVHHSVQSLKNNAELPEAVRQSTSKRMNLFQAINDAMSHAFRADERVILFGEDVAFGMSDGDIGMNLTGYRRGLPLLNEHVAGIWS
jgi:phosphoglycerate-specific signal transduction histidine kinase